MDKILEVNKLLQSGLNLTEVCRQLKRSKNTVRKHAGTLGYFYDAKEKLYLLKPIENAPQENFKQLGDAEYLSKRIDAMAIDIEDLKSDLKRVTKTGSDINILDDELTGELKVKSFKVYTKVLNRFIDFSVNYKSIKKQDLVSQALLEFIKSHE